MSAQEKPAAEDMDAITRLHGDFVERVNDLAMALQDATYSAGRNRGFQEGAGSDVVELRQRLARACGQRQVLALLLAKAIDVVRTVEAEGSTEGAMLAKLIDQADKALRELYDELRQAGA